MDTLRRIVGFHHMRKNRWCIFRRNSLSMDCCKGWVLKGSFGRICLLMRLWKVWQWHCNWFSIFLWYHRRIFLLGIVWGTFVMWINRKLFLISDILWHTCLLSHRRKIQFRMRQVTHKHSLQSFHTRIQDILFRTFWWKDYQKTFMGNRGIWRHKSW